MFYRKHSPTHVQMAPVSSFPDASAISYEIPKFGGCISSLISDTTFAPILFCQRSHLAWCLVCFPLYVFLPCFGYTLSLASIAPIQIRTPLVRCLRLSVCCLYILWGMAARQTQRAPYKYNLLHALPVSGQVNSQ